MATAAHAQVNDGYIGIYADRYGQTPCTSVPQGTGTTLYILAELAGMSPDNITGAEFRIEVTAPDGWFLSYTAPDGTARLDSLLDLDAPVSWSPRTASGRDPLEDESEGSRQRASTPAQAGRDLGSIGRPGPSEGAGGRPVSRSQAPKSAAAIVPARHPNGDALTTRVAPWRVKCTARPRLMSVSPPTLAGR